MQKYTHMPETQYLIGGGIALVAIIVFLITLFNFFALWHRANMCGIPICVFTLIHWQLLKIPIGLIIDSAILARKSELVLDVNNLVAHHLAGGNVKHVVLALIEAEKEGIALTFNRACAIDLATKGTERNVLEAVRTSINPKVIDWPNPFSGRSMIDAIARDGSVVKVKARITVHSNLDRFIGGADEDTLVTRVGDGILVAIGALPSCEDVLDNPDSIEKLVLNMGLDNGTAFDILSVDISLRPSF